MQSIHTCFRLSYRLMYNLHIFIQINTQSDLNLKQLHKRIDLMDVKQLVNNEALLKEVLQDGIRVYGQSQG